MRDQAEHLAQKTKFTVLVDARFLTNVRGGAATVCLVDITKVSAK